MDFDKSNQLKVKWETTGANILTHEPRLSPAYCEQTVRYVNSRRRVYERVSEQMDEVRRSRAWSNWTLIEDWVFQDGDRPFLREEKSKER